jgi:hypothetical protein
MELQILVLSSVKKASMESMYNVLLTKRNASCTETYCRGEQSMTQLHPRTASSTFLSCCLIGEILPKENVSNSLVIQHIQLNPY